MHCGNSHIAKPHKQAYVHHMQMNRVVPLDQAKGLPFWRQPIFLLFLMAAAMPLAFSTWSALLNNFVIEVASFDGLDIGLLHAVREIPGFLAVGVIAVIIFVREQTLALVSLILLGAATAITAWFPSMAGLLTVTMLSSLGFHYYETVNHSLQLQWIDKKRAPIMLSWLVAAGSAASLVAYLAIIATWKAWDLSYNAVYLVSGGLCAVIAFYCLFAFPQFEAPNPQAKRMVLRSRYWLYYALQFLSGARRQIFVVFAAFMMVEKFGFSVDQITTLYTVTLIANIIIIPIFGRAVAHFGERSTLAFEYIGLTLVFLAYGGIYWFGWGVALAVALYILDHIFFAMAFAMKTYFQKIADPADMAPTAAVAFTINHIAAVFLPPVLGILWLDAPGTVFLMAAGIAVGSLVLALLIPRHPEPGNETILANLRPRTAPAE